MTYYEFVYELKERADGFQRMWEEDQRDDPDDGNPTELEFCEWLEEFRAYVED